MNENDYLRFLKGMKDFNESKAESPSGGSALGKQVEFVCYCLNQNHFHFLLKQVKNRGIEKFMHRLGTGYTMYFNRKYDRSGVLFQGSYKAIYVKNNSYFTWLSSYINGNSEIHKSFKASSYKWSSYLEYIDKSSNKFCNIRFILDQFKDIKEYSDFINLVIKESKSRKKEEA